MRLLIVSNMYHYELGGTLLSWGPAVQEIDELAQLFSTVRHVAFMHPGDAPTTALPYRARNVQLVSVQPSGGGRVRDKLKVLTSCPSYIRALSKEMARADVIHIRCPCNIGLFSLILLTVNRRPRMRWVKYAGNWGGYPREPWTYRLQRWILQQGLQGGTVTVNGSWPNQPSHVQSFFNPCLTGQEIKAARKGLANQSLHEPIRLLFVGQLAPSKGAHRALEILARVRREYPATLDVVGDGQERVGLTEQARALGLFPHLRFHGAVPRTQMGTHYMRADLLLLPSDTEGWPKVLSEGMAYGVVPVASDVGSIGQHLLDFSVGRVLPPNDIDGFARAVIEYAKHPEGWRSERDRGFEAARYFTYEHYIEGVREILSDAGM